MTACPPRPGSARPQDLGFTPQHGMVRWLSPRELLSAAARVVVSAVFGAYADKREIQAGLDCSPPSDYSGRPELWLDYVSDLGDGFGATYSLACLLAAERLELGPAGGEPVTTRRGQVLVMGGDQTYPTASIESYQNRSLGPYRAALPFTERDHPHLYALPGNHDWYDGLTAFMRLFCRRQWVGGWQTRQERSYFALQLPHRWWLLGIDIQFDTYIDEPQLRYFRQEVSPRLRSGDSVILCSAKPSWVHTATHPEAYANLDYFEREIVRPAGASVLLALSGDAHHYARYASTTSCAQKVTAGGGGAYLSATHRLPRALELPPPASLDPGKSPTEEYRLASCFPDRARSRRLRWGVARLPFTNPGFWLLVGALHVLYAAMLQDALDRGDQTLAEVLARASLPDLVSGLLDSPLAMMVSLVLAVGLAGFTKSRRWDRRAMGVLHAGAHLLLVLLTIRGASLVLAGAPGPLFLIGMGVALGVVGGLLGSWLMAAYLVVADSVGCNTNELFAAQSNPHHKNFLRLHVDEGGVLTVYPVGVARVARKWRLRRGGRPDDPWFEPRGTAPEAALIEAPIELAGPRPAEGRGAAASTAAPADVLAEARTP